MSGRPRAPRSALRTCARVALRLTRHELALRLTRHELALWTSLLRWPTRRPHGLREAAGDTAVPYVGGQAGITALWLFLSVVETVALALVVPWPLVHATLLLLGVWGVFFVVGMHAACVVRPHVIGADGGLRLRHGALVDIAVPAERVASARRELRSPGGGLLRREDDGTVDLLVGGQTNLTIELSEPVEVRRPLGGTDLARRLRCYADDPDAALAALRRATGAPA